MNTELLSTNELFKALPSFVNDKGTLYHFHLIKGRDGILVWYAKNQSEGGEHLGGTYRKGKDLNDALKQMLDWLIEFNYLGDNNRNILEDMLNNIKQ